MKTRLLILITALLVLLPLIQILQFYTSEVVADGISVSASMVLTLTVVFSILSWFLFSWASKCIRFTGILLSIITGASLVIPFIEVLGPMTGIIVGVVAGFAASMIQKRMTKDAGNGPLVITAITLVLAYFVLFALVLAAQTSNSHMWDTGNGIGSWTGTAEGMERIAVFDHMKIHLNYVLSLIALPSLVVSWITAKDRMLSAIGQYSQFFGIAFMSIGVLFFYNFLTLLVIRGFVALQPNPSITANQFFQMTLEGIVRDMSFHITGIILIIIGILMFGKKSMVKDEN